MQYDGIPIPRLSSERPNYRAVGRPDYHSKGRWMYFEGDRINPKHPPTHYLEWIKAQKEFRAHVVYGDCIKLLEKSPVGNFKPGESFFHYPSDFRHKKNLRQIAKDAVRALEFDFGAVDILWDGENFFVLEVNSAPCLTTKSDTLERYVEAFCAL